MIPVTQHSTIGNHQAIPKPEPVHSPDICPSPEKPSQDVDKSHLSDSTSTTHSLNETCSLDTSGDHFLHLDSPSLSSELQNTSSVESVEPEPVPDFEDLLQLDSTRVSSQDTSSIEIEHVSESEGQLDNANLSPTYVFLEQPDNELFLLQKRLMHHLTISVIRKVMLLKSYVKMTPFSFMLPTLATLFHCPNSWDNTTVKI